MRIALISPSSCSPSMERRLVRLFAHDLAEALTDLGHDVVHFGAAEPRVSGPSQPIRTSDPELRACLELAHAADACREIRHASPRFDLVHSLLPSALPFARYIDAPTLHTVHHAAVAGFEPFYAEFTNVQIVLSLHAQALALGSRAAMRVVHDGLDPTRCPPGKGAGGFVAYLGRIGQSDETQIAIDAAREAGVPLMIAPCEVDEAEAEGASRVSGASLEERSAEVGRRLALIGDARALLVPADALLQPEVLEALLCGTPVIAAASSPASEYVEVGRDGFVFGNAREIAQAMRDASRLDRVEVRRRALERWSHHHCARAYLDVYAEAIERHRAAGSRVSTLVGSDAGTERASN